jgi:hypothetical protein
MVTFGAVKEREYTLIEQGEYVLTLSELDESEGNWGSRLVWKFMVAPPADPTAYICNANGDERTVWAFTDLEIIVGSLGHEFVEKLTGKTFTKGTEPPDEDDLLGRRVLGYVTHHTPTKGKNAGKKQEQIVAGSIKVFKGPQPNAVKRLDPKAAAPAASDADKVRAEAIERVGKLIGKAVTLGTPRHLDFVAIDLDAADLDDLQMLANTIKEEVQAALDAD